jgi:hypothetical protein
LGGFLPRKPARSTGEEKHIGFSHGALAIAPRYFFHDDGTTALAVDPPHGIEQEDEKSPKRDKFETPLGELIVPRAGWWQREQIAAEPWRGRTDTSMLFLSGLNRACW